MKEAAGEANMTVITIVLIAIVLTVGTIIVRSMMDNSGKSSACSSFGGSWAGGKCTYKDSSGADQIATCKKATADNDTLGVKKGEYYCTGVTTN